MAEAELLALRVSFHNQAVMLKKLRAEFEEERKAAASGVEEALSMIMRLQEEKAAQKLEACQYQRMVEEKMQHAEESMAFLNEVIFQKGLENASLKFQVQNYKQKLLSIGIKDFDFESIKINACPWSKKGSTFAGKTNLDRNMSLPAIRLEELLSEIDTADKYCSLLHDRQLTPMENVECSKQIMDEYITNKVHIESSGMMEECDTNKVHNFLKEFRQEPTYANRRLKKLLTPKRYKENDCTTYEDISRTETMNLEEERDCSWNPGENYSDKSTFLLKINEEYPGKRSKLTSLSRRIARTRSCGERVNSIAIQDIYEIQDSHNGDSFRGTYNDIPRGPMSRAKSINRNPNSLQGSSFGRVEDQNLPFKSSIYVNYESNSTKQHEDGFLTTQECSSKYVSCPTDIEQLKERMQRLEDSVRNIKQEDQERDTEQSELLRIVVEQLSTIGAHFKKLMSKFDCQQNDDCVLLLVEAMQCFWL